MANKLTHTTISSPNGINEVCSMMTIDTISNPFVFHNILLPTETEYVYTTYVKSSVDGSITVAGNSVSTTTSWEKKVIPFSNTNTSNKNLQISFGTAGTYYFYHTKLETGNLSTHYSSAPEDNHDTLQHIQTVAEQTADGFKWFVNGSQETGFYISDGGIEAITEKFTIKGSDGTKTVINGGRIEAGSIIGDDIKANTITARELTVENIYSSDNSSWINFDKGTFDYGNGKLSWNGSTLNIDGNGSFSGTINATSGSFSGTVNASAGSFSGWTITSDGLKRASAATQTAYTNSNPSGTTQNFWSTWFDFSKINKWNDTTASGGSGQSTLNTGDMYFGNSGLAISSNFTVDSSGYMKSKSGEIGGFTIDSSKISFSNSGTSTSGYLSSSDANFIYVNKGNSQTYDKFYVTNTGTLTLEHQATESVPNENGENDTVTSYKKTSLENGNIRTTGLILVGDKTSDWMDGNIGVRIHPKGTMQIEGNSDVIPELYLTLNNPKNSTKAQRWDGSIRVLNDSYKTFELVARPSASGGKGAMKLRSDTLDITGAINATSSLSVTGATTAKGTLSVTGAVTASSTVTVGSSATNTVINATAGITTQVLTARSLILCGNKTSTYQDGKTGLRIHPDGTMHLQRDGAPEIGLTNGTGTAYSGYLCSPTTTSIGITGNQESFLSTDSRATNGVSIALYNGKRSEAISQSSTGGGLYTFLWCGKDSTSFLVRSYPIYNRTYSSAANVYVTSEGTLGRYSSSSIRYKNNVTYYTNEENSTISDDKKSKTRNANNLLSLLKLPIVTFNYNNGYVSGEGNFDYNKPIAGFIAEDVERIDSDCCTYKYETIKDNDFELPYEIKTDIVENWNERAFIPRMLYIDQYQEKRINELEQTINSLVAEINNLKNQINN